MARSFPSISGTAFECPYCGAYTTQHWSKIYSEEISGDRRTPLVPTREGVERVKADSQLDELAKVPLVEWGNKMIAGRPFFKGLGSRVYPSASVENLFLTECYNCKNVAVWVYDSLQFPTKKTGSLPAADLPEDIKFIFEEARSILADSPKGAAALLRLCIQMLCKALGESGAHIDSDIASLVRKGLNPTVQKSLDIVRVVGNEAVHPGTIDLNDNRDIAEMLFDLVNSITEQMISHPKTVDELYSKLPPDKREAIEKRDKKKIVGKPPSAAAPS